MSFLFSEPHFFSLKAMDSQTFSVQQARVASFLNNLLSVCTHFAKIEDDPEPRGKTTFQQHVRWDDFVKKHKDGPLFRRHMRMSYIWNTMIKFPSTAEECANNAAQFEGTH